MIIRAAFSFFFFFNDTATTEIYTLSLHDALPICGDQVDAMSCGSGMERNRRPVAWNRAVATAGAVGPRATSPQPWGEVARSEEHTSELQSPCNLVCRLLLEKKKKKQCMILVWLHV